MAHRSPTKRAHVSDQSDDESANSSQKAVSESVASSPRKKHRSRLAPPPRADSSSDIVRAMKKTHITSSAPSPSESSSRRESTYSSSRSQSPSQGPQSFKSYSPLYNVLDDELEETAALQLIGEELEDSDGGDKPVCLLTNFSIFERGSRNPIHFGALVERLHLDHQYCASGIVRPWLLEEDLDDIEGDEELVEQHILLPAISEISIYHINRNTFDSNIYLETQYAWYILDMPSQPYLPFYNDFYLKHHVVCLVLSVALEDPGVGLADFLAAISSEDFADFDPLFEIITEGALQPMHLQKDDIKSYLLGTVDEIRNRYGVKKKLGRSLLIKEVLDGFCIPANVPTLTVAKPNIMKSLQNQKEKTVVTPMIYKISTDYFLQQFAIVGLSRDSDTDLVVEDQDHPTHYNNAESVQWLQPYSKKGYWKAVKMDGAVYSIGDIVAVVPGNDADAVRAKHALASSSQSNNHLANLWWFCQIQYFYQIGSEKMFHVRWFEHGSKTILEELANPNGLFFSKYECHDLNINCIFMKVEAHQLRQGELQPFLKNDTQFYFSHYWDRDNSAFTYLSPAESKEALALCQSPEICLGCGMQEMQKLHKKMAVTDFHEDDFIYLLPSSDDTLYTIARVIKKHPCISVEVYTRSGPVDGILDEQRLVQTFQVQDVDQSLIAGICYVIHPDLLDPSISLDEWLSQDDHFFVISTLVSDDIMEMPSEKFKTCKQCHEDRFNAILNKKFLLEGHQPLQALELFSGAGGLSIGFHSTPFIETKWAVEMWEPAAKTYQQNNPKSTVYATSANTLLQQTIEAQEGGGNHSIPSLSGLQPMPKPGEVDFIYGGPPCQSFSGANYHKVPDDPRSALIANFMSWVDYYRPQYFLIENVTGMLIHRLKARKVGNCIEGGIEMGMVKFIMRAATTLGYQVHCKVLQAAEYGSPQSRERLIFMGSKGLTPLPHFPIPTHCFPRRVQKRKTVTGKFITGINRLPDRPEVGSAPFPRVTINDAISDLPPFDWINPHMKLKVTRSEERELAVRKSQGIHQFIAHDRKTGQPSGFADPVAYVSKPRNSYQMWMRATSGAKVALHHTRMYPPIVVERTVNVPLRPDCDHSNLPNELIDTAIASSGEAKKLKGIYARLDGNGHFNTALTSIQPTAKPGGKVLHPTQKRVITVRESARAQGFPDDYVFFTDGKTADLRVKDILKQIGNAVPVPLGRALGMAIGDSVMKVWMEHDRKGSPEL